MLVVKYYDLEDGISSPERFERVNKFEELRMKLGIPNPYSFRELVQAQNRWSDLGYQEDTETFF